MQAFILTSPKPSAVQYLICINTANATEAIETAIALSSLVYTLLTSQQGTQLNSLLHFATKPCATISPQLANIMGTWMPMPLVNKVLIIPGEADQQGSGQEHSRLDCQAFWCQATIPSDAAVNLMAAPDLCTQPLEDNYKSSTEWMGRFLLLANSSRSNGCTYGDILTNAAVRFANLN